jgi:hypothetical protein
MDILNRLSDREIKNAEPGKKDYRLLPVGAGQELHADGPL